jgi:hypothetical protein
MKTILVRLLNIAMFVVVWIAAFMALHWLILTQVLETRHIAPGQVPANFSVAVETRANGTAPSYSTMGFRSQAELKLEPGESLHLSTAAYDQMSEEVTGDCCIAFKVLEDGPNGQLIELHTDDMSYVMSRYRVRDGQVEPLAHRAEFTLYYLAYFFFGGLVAWLVTRPIRRRTLAWARRRGVASEGGVSENGSG